MSREHLELLDQRFAFQTSARFDLLAGDHVAFPALGGPDVETKLRSYVEAAEGVIAVIGRIGSGKSSLIASVLEDLDETFVPLPVSIAGAEAQNPVAFARHALREIDQIPDVEFDRHEQHALERATAGQRVTEARRELRAGLELVAGKMVSGKVVTDIKKITSEQLVQTDDATAAMAGLDDVLAVLWKAGRCPVLVVNDTDHWDASPDVADSFFDQTARAMGQKDMVLVVAAQTEYTHLPGYIAIKQALREVALPALPDPQAGIARILQHRIDREEVPLSVDELLEPEGLVLVGNAYFESTDENSGGDLRRTIAVVRTALELALNDPAGETINAGHVQEALSRNPLTPARVLAQPDPGRDAVS